MFFNSVGIVNAATTPITPRVINTSAKVNANFLFGVIPLKSSLQAGFKLPPPRNPLYYCVFAFSHFLSFVMLNSLTFVFFVQDYYVTPFQSTHYLLIIFPRNDMFFPLYHFFHCFSILNLLSQIISKIFSAFCVVIFSTSSAVIPRSFAISSATYLTYIG